jgi:hypothetical protein
MGVRKIGGVARFSSSPRYKSSTPGHFAALLRDSAAQPLGIEVAICGCEQESCIFSLLVLLFFFSNLHPSARWQPTGRASLLPIN